VLLNKTQKNKKCYNTNSKSEILNPKQNSKSQIPNSKLKPYHLTKLKPYHLTKELSLKIQKFCDK